jgi:hypothetical protein
MSRVVPLATQTSCVCFMYFWKESIKARIAGSRGTWRALAFWERDWCKPRYPSCEPMARIALQGQGDGWTVVRVGSHGCNSQGRVLPQWLLALMHKFIYRRTEAPHNTSMSCLWTQVPEAKKSYLLQEQSISKFPSAQKTDGSTVTYSMLRHFSQTCFLDPYLTSIVSCKQR